MASKKTSLDISGNDVRWWLGHLAQNLPDYACARMADRLNNMRKYYGALREADNGKPAALAKIGRDVMELTRRALAARGMPSDVREYPPAPEPGPGETRLMNTVRKNEALFRAWAARCSLPGAQQHVDFLFEWIVPHPRKSARTRQWHAAADSIANLYEGELRQAGAHIGRGPHSRFAKAIASALALIDPSFHSEPAAIDKHLTDRRSRLVRVYQRQLAALDPSVREAIIRSEKQLIGSAGAADFSNASTE